MADIMVVTTFIVLAAVASILLTNSYKKLLRSVIRNGGTIGVTKTDVREDASIAEKPAESICISETVQAPLEESQSKEDTISAEPVSSLTNVQEKLVEAPVKIEQPAAMMAVEAMPQTSGRVRRKRSTTRTRSTKRPRSKKPKAQPSTESQPPN